MEIQIAWKCRKLLLALRQGYGGFMNSFVFHPPAQIQFMRLNQKINIGFYYDLTGKIDLGIGPDVNLVVLDMLHVTELSKFGFLSFHNWIYQMSARQPLLRIHLKNCPRDFLQALQSGHHTLPENVFIESFFATYMNSQSEVAEDYLLMAGIHFFQDERTREIHCEIPESILGRSGAKLTLQETAGQLAGNLRNCGIISRIQDHGYSLL